MCDLLKNHVIPTFVRKVMLAQCDYSFPIHFIPYPGNSVINLLLCTLILAWKIFLIAFFDHCFIFPLLFLNHLEVIHKFLYTVKLSSPVILQIWGNKSGSGADPHPVWTWWSSIYLLLSATFPLNVCIIYRILFPMAIILTLFVSVITVVRRIIIAWQWAWRVLFIYFTKIFLLIAFLFIWFTVIDIIRRIRFFRLWVWQWWVWIWVPWYVHFSILFCHIRWLCQWRRLWIFFFN